MSRPTYDALAVDLLLAGDLPGLRRLARQASDRLDSRAECPACESLGPHQDNGTETLCCGACGEHFEPAGGL